MLAQATSVGYIHEPFNPNTSPGIAGGRFEHFLERVSVENGERYAGDLARMLRFSYNWGRQLPSVRSPREAARTVREGVTFMRLRLSHARPLVKDPIALLSADWLADRFAMDVVVTVRQPAAVVASFKRLGWRHDFAPLLEHPKFLRERLGPFEADIRRSVDHPGDTVDAAILLWRVLHATIDRYRIEHPDWTFVRHEDLSRDPLGGFRGLYDTLGLDFTERARGAVAAHSSSLNARAQARRHDTRLDSQASLEGWRRVLTEDEEERVRRGVADVAPAFYAAGEW